MQEITKGEYIDLIKSYGGYERLRVHSTFTIAKETELPDGDTSREEHIITEWSLPDSNKPILRYERKGEIERYWRYE